MKLCLIFLTVGLLVDNLSAKLLAVKKEKPEQVENEKYEIGDKEYLKQYKLILELFYYINQPSYFKNIVDIADSFDLLKSIENYKNPEVVEDFLSLQKKGSLLARGEIFSIFYEQHLQEAKSLFKLFYYAKDFKILYETACWARQNLNEGLFLYSFSVALTQRQDCLRFNLPPIYEIYPNYFFNSETIQKASYLKQKYRGLNDSSECKKSKDGYDGFTINSSYSGYYLNLHPEQALSYYLEDIGINSFYYYYNLYYPFWLSSSESGKQSDIYHRRGEIFYFSIQQILARYYLERLANNFGSIKDFDWDLPFETGYYPSLRYPNGLEFPARSNFVNLKEYYFNYGQKQCPKDYQFSYTYVQDYSRRLRDLIDKGVTYSPINGKPIRLDNNEGLELLGNIIQSNADSLNPRYYGPLLRYARHLLGYSYQPKNKNQLAPSSLEHFETSLRDPAFYQLYKKIFYLFDKFKSYLPPYDKEDLLYQGVEIKNVEFDELKNYFDYFYSDLSNTVLYTPEETKNDTFRIRAKQYRLNQNPFNYTINVSSEYGCQASVRVYLGPKYDEYGRPIDIRENRINFVEFDYFQYNLTVGENIIERNYKELFGYCDDRTSIRDLYKQVLLAESGKGEYKIQPHYVCFPRRFALPKGTYDGKPYQFYIIVSPYKPDKAGRSHFDIYQYPIFRMEDYPLGYPFDRPIYDIDYYNVPNAYFYEAKIYFEGDINKNRPF